MRTKRLIRQLVLFLLVLFYAGPAVSSVAFYHYGIENGLPESRIVSISQDSTGYIWLAGENGLFRFDGMRFNVFQNTYSNQSPVSFTRINTLFTDSRGTLWVGSNDGLSRFNYENNQFVKLAADFEQQRILDIYEDVEGKLWLASEMGLAKYDPDSEKTVWFTASSSSKNAVYKNLPSSYILQLTGQPDGKIWLSTFPAGLYLFNPKSGEITDYTKTGETDFSKFNVAEIHYHAGSLFVGTLANGFYQIDVQQHSVKNKKVDHLVPAVQHFRQLNDSVFWIATNNGLLRYNILTETFTRYTNEPNNPLSLNRTTVNFVYLDKDENLWLSLGIRGIDFGLAGVPFSYLTPGADGAYELAHKEVTAIRFDNTGNMWLGYEAGLVEKHQYDPLQKHQYRITSKKTGNSPGSVMAIFEDSKNRIWAGGWMTGLNVFIPEKNTFEPVIIQPDSVYNLVETADVRGFAEDKNGNIWISFHGIGLGKFNPQSRKLQLFVHDPANPASSLSNNYTYNLCFDQNENLWIASAHGLSKFQPEAETFSTFFHDPNNAETLNSSTISAVYCDDSGVVWAGTEKGLNAYSPALENFIPVFTDKDFPFLSIASIQSVKPGEIWLSTTNGIFRVNYEWNEEKTAMNIKASHFNRSDGLLSSNYFARSGATTGDGSLFFGGNEGIDHFNPENVLSYNEKEVKPLITELWIDGKPVYPARLTEEKNKMSLVLNHNHNMLAIRFTALGFTSTGIKNFRYKLEGVQNDWVYLQNEQIASFTHLPPGNYSFIVETQQKNNEWTTSDSTLEIRVKRPFWLSVPFYIIVFLAVSAAVYLVVKARSKVLIMRQNELREIIRVRTQELTRKNKELEIANQAKDKFFSIISHDLRSPFSGLIGILDLLTDDENSFDPEEQKELLRAAKSSAHNTLELLENLLLWARSQMRTTTTSAKKQNLSEVLEKNLALKKPVASQKEISLTGDFPEKLEALFDREMINTVIRNILSNAIKFTPKGGHVNVSALAKNGEVTVSIADSGIGIDENDPDKLFEPDKVNRKGTQGEKGTGLGLVISKEFIKNNHGKIWAEANQPTGTIFRFTLPTAQH